MSDAQAVRQALEILRNQFPAEHPDINAGTVQVWLGGLQRYPSGTVIEAAVSYGALVFPGLNQFLAHVDSTARLMIDAERERRRTAGIDTVACPECGDGAGWVEDQGRQTDGYDVPVRPCSSCSFPSFWLWKNGHLGKNHTCSLCRDRRRHPERLAEAIAADGGWKRQPVIDATATDAAF